MKKTINTNIGGTIFNLEEDAYQKLEQYLDGIKHHFSKHADSEEIVRDMENRIAEIFNEKKSKIISEEDVTSLIASMGQIEDFDSETEEAQPNNSLPRRFFRDPENRIIAGVASGIGSYFNIDPIIIRVLFLAIVLAGGSGIFLYLVLWIIMPEAKTATERMQMRGEPINLNNLDKTLKEEAERIKSHKGIQRAGQTARSIFGAIFLAIGKILGVIISFFVGIVLIMLTFAAVNLTFNAHADNVFFPLAQVATGPEYYFMIAAAFLIFLIPIIFVAYFGVRLLTNKPRIGTRSVSTLLGLWFIALIAGGALMVRYMPTYAERIQALPEYQIETRTYDFKDFSKLDLHGVDQVKITKSDQFSVKETGKQIDLSRTKLEVNTNTLTMTQESLRRFCFFCGGRNRATVEISMPKIDEVNLGGVVSIELTGFKQDALKVTSADVASGTVNAEIKNLNVEATDASRLSFIGNIENADIYTKDVARVEIQASKVITARAEDASRIYYSGTATLNQTVKDAAKILKAGEQTEQDYRYRYPMHQY